MDMEPELVVKDKAQVVKKALSELISTKYRSAVRFYEKDMVLDAMCLAVANKGRIVQPVQQVVQRSQQHVQVQRSQQSVQVETKEEVIIQKSSSHYRQEETIVRSSNIRKVEGLLGWVGLGWFERGV